METLNTFLNLISKTEGRDKFLRLIQYATLHTVDQNTKTPINNLYKQMRMTRKILRFIRSLEYSTKARKNWGQMRQNMSKGQMEKAALLFLILLENLFTFLFILSDHRVCLAELGIISKETGAIHYTRSMKFAFIKNLVGVIKNIMNLSMIIMNGKKELSNEAMVVNAIKKSSFDLIKCFLDCFVDLYYWKGKMPAKKIGIIGVITSIMQIMQVLEKQ